MGTAWKDAINFSTTPSEKQKPPDGPPFSSPESVGLDASSSVPLQRRLPSRIEPQRGAIVEVHVAEGQTINCVAQQIDLPVNNEVRVAWIGQRLIQRGDQTEARSA